MCELSPRGWKGVRSGGDCFQQAGKLNRGFRGLGPQPVLSPLEEATLPCLHLRTPRILTRQNPGFLWGQILSEEALP